MYNTSSIRVRSSAHANIYLVNVSLGALSKYSKALAQLPLSYLMDKKVVCDEDCREYDLCGLCFPIIFSHCPKSPPGPSIDGYVEVEVRRSVYPEYC